MDNNVANVLAELRQDHKNMSLLLTLLERESDRMYDCEDTDFDLLHDIMHYMTVYPDAVHHPKEDRIYAELKAIRPDLTAGFKRITVDHRYIAELSITLRDDFASIIADQIVPRKTVVADALRYVHMLRGHMQWEELDLFRRVERMIADGHHFIEAATYLQSCDPVFGPKIEPNFEKLTKRIRESVNDD